jgi:hypothetical protein
MSDKPARGPELDLMGGPEPDEEGTDVMAGPDPWGHTDVMASPERAAERAAS